MPDLSRRAALGAAALLLPAMPVSAADIAGGRLDALEKHSGARIGLTAVDTGSGRAIFYREGERFLFCSTIKFLAVAALLARVDRGAENLARIVRYTKNDLLDYAPITAKHVATGMSLAALCEAAITYSDNSAGNLLFAALGGPAGVNSFVRGLGDASTHMDRIEPSLNVPDGARDTTTPVAMLGDLKTILLGDALSPASRQRLNGWLAANTTGGALLKAGLPPDWRIGDKTGRGAGGAINDIAIVTPPGRKPVLIAAYTRNSSEAVLAEIGRIVGGHFA